MVKVPRFCALESFYGVQTTRCRCHEGGSSLLIFDALLLGCDYFLSLPIISIVIGDRDNHSLICQVMSMSDFRQYTTQSADGTILKVYRWNEQAQQNILLLKPIILKMHNKVKLNKV